MSDSAEHADKLELAPLPYHKAVRAYLKAEEPDVWHWYASHRIRAEQAEAVRFELLKSTYRLEPDAQPEIYARVGDVAGKQGLDMPVTRPSRRPSLSQRSSWHRWSRFSDGQEASLS